MRTTDETLDRYLRALDAVTPPRIRATDPAHPEFNAALWERVQDWKMTVERPWLGLVGPTGTSKTRIIYLALRQVARADAAAGRTFEPRWTDGPTFSRSVLAQFRGTDEQRVAAVEILDRVRGADVLVFDELGKVQASSAVVAEAFALIDHRHARNKLTVWTSNRSPQEACATWGEEYAATTAGRILEASTIFKA